MISSWISSLSRKLWMQRICIFLGQHPLDVYMVQVNYSQSRKIVGKSAKMNQNTICLLKFGCFVGFIWMCLGAPGWAFKPNWRYMRLNMTYCLDASEQEMKMAFQFKAKSWWLKFGCYKASKRRRCILKFGCFEGCIWVCLVAPGKAFRSNSINWRYVRLNMTCLDIFGEEKKKMKMAFKFKAKRWCFSWIVIIYFHFSRQWHMMCSL